jgi:hypothetical protein
MSLTSLKYVSQLEIFSELWHLTNLFIWSCKDNDILSIWIDSLYRQWYQVLEKLTDQSHWEFVFREDSQGSSSAQKPKYVNVHKNDHVDFLLIERWPYC